MITTAFTQFLKKWKSKKRSSSNKTLFAPTKQMIFEKMKGKDLSQEKRDKILFYHNHLEKWLAKTNLELNRTPIISIVGAFNPCIYFRLSIKPEFELHMDMYFDESTMEEEEEQYEDIWEDFISVVANLYDNENKTNNSILSIYGQNIELMLTQIETFIQSKINEQEK